MRHLPKRLVGKSTEMGSDFNVEAVLEAVLSKLKVLAETGQTFGQPITIGETIIVPYMSLHFGLGGGGGNFGKTASGFRGNGGDPASLFGGAGGGVRIEPVGFLVIRGERVELLTTAQKPDQWNQLSEALVPLLQQWLQTRAGIPSDRPG
ncbi:GerW family sporulation protein [Synechococcus sp. R55.6]|uniref:GerW family sporulation protein n=1 Tax=unclassified Synechococcus TaxID=2626047 RepID=UPI0039C00E7D